ncbi:MAG: argininosuccinate synthase [Armatimonadetes bacterium]|nr:argininosuccinate synthase [Armatimonadota bacterium]
MPKTVVLVYSGGLDTSVCIPMMRENYGFERIVTVTVDVGQPDEDVKSAEDRARALGCEHYTADAKQEFITDYCWPAVKANGDYQGYPLSTAIARPLIGLKAVEAAKQVGADAFCHGCTGKGNDQFRIEYVMRALLPDTPIIAPMREHSYTRTEEIQYAQEKNIPISVTADKIWSIDENLWGRSIEGGHLEEPNYAPPEEIYQWTRGIDAANPTPQALTIGFEHGVPVSLDGERLEPLALVQKLMTIAGDNGVGRVDIMEDRLLGLKVRENYECPASTVLIKAHAALEALVATAAERKFKAMVDQQWGELAYYGLWFDPLKEDLEAFINRIQRRVTGTVTLRLFKGSCVVTGRASDWALYNEDLASFDSKTFDQSLSVGNVQTHGMQSRMYWQLKEKQDKG